MQLQDDKLVKLKAQLGSLITDTNVDLEPFYASAIGLALKDQHVQQIWHEHWDNEAIPAGNYNDRASAWLLSLGFTQLAVQDQWAAFWATP